MRFWNKIKERLKTRKQLKEIEVKNQIKEVKITYDGCFKCGRQFTDFTDKYRCKYCQKYFCSDHRLPENHNCSGNPKAPPHHYRVIISGNTRKTINK
jgi:predicted nucleic acid binding AN1-type Zn finger protein